MNEPQVEKTEYERLTEEFARTVSANDLLGKLIQQGFAAEDFVDSRIGQYVAGACISECKRTLAVILDPTAPPNHVELAVQELRMHHGMLSLFYDAIRKGRDATAELNRQEIESPNPDEEEPL